MRTTIDKAGRVVVPKELRDRLGLGGGGEVEVDEVDGAIEIRPAPVSASVVRTSTGVVIRAEEPVQPVTDDDVRRTLEAIRH